LYEWRNIHSFYFANFGGDWMITLYDSSETNFEHNGIGILSDCISCKVHREINNTFYVELEYPLYDKKNLYLELQQHRIIKTPTPNGSSQLFRIQRTEKSMSTIFVYATHILFDLKENLIIDTNIVGKTRLEAFQELLDNTMNPHNFTVTGDITTYQDTARIVRYSPLKAIFGTEDNCILNRWGGEVDVDNFNIIVKDFLGVDTQEVISYGKNLKAIRETLNMDTVATRIIPQGANELLLPEYFIDSPLIGAYYQPIVRHMLFNDIKVDESTTQEQACQMLRDVVQKLFDEKHVDEPFFNYEVDFMYLGDTEEYKQFKNLNTLNLGDRLKIRHQKLNIDLNGNIIAYDYNSISKKYIKIEIGTIKKDINMVINQTVAQVQFLSEKVEIEVATLDERLSSKIDVTEQSILQVVTDKTNDLQSQVTQQADGVNIQIGSINERMDLNETDIQNINTYFDFNTNGMTIGKSDSPLNITISNFEMDFIDNGNIVAYVNGQKMYISSLEVLNSLIVGVHKIEKYNDSITLIKWVGGN
jgi:phage minor structural protein